MSGKRFNKVNAGIVFLLVLVLVSGLLFTLPLVGGGDCGASNPSYIGGIITKDGNPVSGVDIILFIDDKYSGNITTGNSGSYFFGSDDFSSNTYLIIIKNGTINSDGPFTIQCNVLTERNIIFNSSVPKPDLYLSDLSAPESLKPYQKGTLTVSVYNNHTSPVSVDVAFYDNSIGDENFIGKVYNIFIPPHSTRYASVLWNGGAFGNHTIIAIVDPDDKIDETNDGNNLANATIDVQGIDIYLNSSDISFTPESPWDFQSVTITATVHISELSSFDFEVSFYDGNSINGTFIGSSTVTFTETTSTDTSMSWSPPYGHRTVTVVADPYNEINGNDNQANKTIFISGDIPKDKVVFTYLYYLSSPNYQTGLNYLTKLYDIFDDRIVIKKGNCGDLGNFLCNKILSCISAHPGTMSIGKKSVSETDYIDHNKVNCTSGFPEGQENETFNQWIENICYQFEVKPNACLPCDLNNDGIIIRDYRELMDAYKCFLGVKKNCRDLNGNGITFKDWNEMKHEYECFIRS